MHKALIYIIVAVLSLSGSRVAVAQEAEVPVKVQFALFCKALTFDHALETRCGDTLVIGLLYQSRFRTSKDAMRDVKDEAAEKMISEVKGIPLQLVAIDQEEKDWTRLAVDRSIDVLYLMPVRAMEIEEMTGFTREHHVLSWTAQYGRVKGGVSMGARLLDGRPKFVINLDASRQEGAELSSQLLRLAEVLNK